MATLMRCTTAHWQGNTFIGLGTIRPEGHREVIPIYFEPYATEEPAEKSPPPTKRAGRA